jgi:hypothetical protein
MRFIVGGSILLTAALAIACLYAGRQITSFLDRLITLPVAALPVEPIKYDGGGFVIGQLQMTFGSTDNQRYDLALQTSPAKQVVLCARGRLFTLGPRTNPVDPSGRPEIQFVPTRGDQLSFTARRSIFGWPTPFEYNFMTRSPRWKRYVYYRLVWKKDDGSTLEMLWRYQQDYYRPKGWEKPEMMWNWYTGLIRVGMSGPKPGYQH